MTDISCPCGSPQTLAACCGPRLDGSLPAPTAEALMRSRYTAYVLEQRAYLRETWHPATCPATLVLVPDLRWLGLVVRRVEAGGCADATGIVEFVARCKQGGRASRLHEVSHFERCRGRWVYVRGESPSGASCRLPVAARGSP